MAEIIRVGIRGAGIHGQKFVIQRLSDHPARGNIWIELTPFQAGDLFTQLGLLLPKELHHINLGASDELD